MSKNKLKYVLLSLSIPIFCTIFTTTINAKTIVPPPINTIENLAPEQDSQEDDGSNEMYDETNINVSPTNDDDALEDNKNKIERHEKNDNFTKKEIIEKMLINNTLNKHFIANRCRLPLNHSLR